MLNGAIRRMAWADEFGAVENIKAWMRVTTRYATPKATAALVAVNAVGIAIAITKKPAMPAKIPIRFFAARIDTLPVSQM